VNVGAREGETVPVYEKTPAVCSNVSQVKVIYNGWTNGVFISPCISAGIIFEGIVSHRRESKIFFYTPAFSPGL
jgi:hypothetical protein